MDKGRAITTGNLLLTYTVENLSNVTKPTFGRLPIAACSHNMPPAVILLNFSKDLFLHCVTECNCV